MSSLQRFQKFNDGKQQINDVQQAKMSTIHLIGSEGFIGQAIQREVGVTNTLPVLPSSIDPEHHFNLMDSCTWQPLLKKKPKHVVLLSWPGLPNYQDLFHVTRNLPACVELIEKLTVAGMQRLVIAGTCYEYGLKNGPLSESDLTSPVNCYAIAKDALRRIIATRYKNSELSWCWLRIFFPYGIGQNPKSLLPSLQDAIEQGKPTFAMSSGRQLRDFIPVEKIAQQLLLLAVDPRAYGIYNGGSGQARSLREIVESRVQELNAEIKLDFGIYPDRDDEALAFWADMSRMNTLT